MENDSLTLWAGLAVAGLAVECLVSVHLKGANTPDIVDLQNGTAAAQGISIKKIHADGSWAHGTGEAKGFELTVTKPGEYTFHLIDSNFYHSHGRYSCTTRMNLQVEADGTCRLDGTSGNRSVKLMSSDASVKSGNALIDCIVRNPESGETTYFVIKM